MLRIKLMLWIGNHAKIMQKPCDLHGIHNLCIMAHYYWKSWEKICRQIYSGAGKCLVRWLKIPSAMLSRSPFVQRIYENLKIGVFYFLVLMLPLSLLLALLSFALFLLHRFLSFSLYIHPRYVSILHAVICLYALCHYFSRILMHW